MMTGFGCSVPGILATRTLENERDRLATRLVLPLMSCGARLPIWMLLIPAFFSQAWLAPVLWLLYATGILLALDLASLLRRTVLRGEDVPFVMELPPYGLPTARSVLAKMLGRAGLYLRKAGRAEPAGGRLRHGPAPLPAPARRGRDSWQAPQARHREARQAREIAAALAESRSVAVDNTNATRQTRAALIELARRYGARVIGYYLESRIDACRARNERREGRKRVPLVALYATAKRLERPALEEGFDELRFVRMSEDAFIVLPWEPGGER